MPWIRTLSLDDADDKVLEAMAQQRTLYPREYAQPVQELDQGLPGIVASHTLIPEALYHAFATTSTAWRIRWGSAGIESWCKGTHRNCLPCGRAPSHYFVRSSWPLSCSSTSKRWLLGSRKKKRSKGVSRRGSITLSPWAIRRFLSVGKPARGRLSAMCRPYSCSNGEGWNSGTSTRCSSCPGAICSQAAGAALFRGRPIGVQPRTSWKKAVDRASSQVARVLPRQERSSQTGNHGTTPPYGEISRFKRHFSRHRRGPHHELSEVYQVSAGCGPGLIGRPERPHALGHVPRISEDHGAPSGPQTTARRSGCAVDRASWPRDSSFAPSTPRHAPRVACAARSEPHSCSARTGHATGSFRSRPHRPDTPPAAPTHRCSSVCSPCPHSSGNALGDKCIDDARRPIGTAPWARLTAPPWRPSSSR